LAEFELDQFGGDYAKETAATIAAAASKDGAGKTMVLLAKDRAVRLLGCEKRVQLINSFWVTCNKAVHDLPA
jgi:hypothetical protein